MHEEHVMSAMLNGERILVVEDDFVMALDICGLIEELGGTVVGPVGRLDQGLTLAESEEVDGAILDVNLGRENTYSLADKLLAEEIPVVLTTGYEVTMLPPRFADLPHLGKPFGANAAERIFHKAFVGKRLNENGEVPAS
jgi:CheY-like chemotaxis protein